MANKWAAGCGCCGTCVFAEDDFNRADSGTVDGWTEVSGTWDIDGQELETGDSSGVITNDTGHPDTSPNMVVDVDFRVTDEDDTIRVYLAYDGVDDYVAVEVTVAASGTLKLFESVAGTETQLGSTVSLGDVPEGEWHHLRACYCDECGDGPDGKLSAIVTVDTGSGYSCSYDASEDAEVQTGTTAGVGTETIAVNAFFDNFVAAKYGDSANPRCPTCASIVCEGCEFSGALATTAQVTVIWTVTPESECDGITWDCGCFDTICAALTGSGDFPFGNSHFLDLAVLCTGECIYFYCEELGIDCSNDEDAPGEDCIDPADPDRLYLMIIGTTDYDLGWFRFCWTYYAVWSRFADDGDLCAATVDVAVAKARSSCGVPLIGFCVQKTNQTDPDAACNGIMTGIPTNQPWGTVVVDAEGRPTGVFGGPQGGGLCNIDMVTVRPSNWGAQLFA